MPADAALTAAFAAQGFEVTSPIAARELAAIAAAHALAPDALARRWTLFDLDRLAAQHVSERTSVGVERVEEFASFVSDALAKESARDGGHGGGTPGSGFGKKKKRKLTTSTPTSGASPTSSAASTRVSFGGVTPKKMPREWARALDELTPGVSEYSKSVATPGSATSGGGEGARAATLHANLSARAEFDGDDSGCEVYVSTTGVRGDDFRYMRDRISDRVRAVDARIVDAESRFEFIGEEVEDGEGEAAETDVAASATSRISRVDTRTGDEDATCVGRVVNAQKSDATGKMTEKSVDIEGSTEGSFGARVRLELRDVSNYSLFPGQVVKVTGRNPAGHCLVAKEISSVSAKPMKMSAPTSAVFAKPTTAVIASGPFSCAKDLKYEPLNDLLDFVVAENPDALILCGPLVDVENAFIKTGTCGDLDFDDVALNVTQTIERKLGFNDGDSKIKTKVIYVPSVRDATLDAVFPQPAPKRESLFTSSTRAYVASNPGTFEINGAVFSVVSHDILKHLSAQEISKGFASKERLTRLATHVVSQANAYPLYPADPSACLDAAHADALALDVTPDVLILPSDLKTFAEVLEVSDVGQVVCVNPGRLARGDLGGTLAKLVVHAKPPTPSASADDADVPHDVAPRARVDIMKIK